MAELLRDAFAAQRGVGDIAAIANMIAWALIIRLYIIQAYKGAVFIFGDKERCLLYTSPSPRDRQKSRMPSSA